MWCYFWSPWLLLRNPLLFELFRPLLRNPLLFELFCPLGKVSLYSGCFQDFFFVFKFVFKFRSLIVTYLDMDFFGFILWVHWASWVCGVSLLPYLGSFQPPAFSSPSRIHQNNCEIFCYSITCPQDFLPFFFPPICFLCILQVGLFLLFSL